LEEKMKKTNILRLSVRCLCVAFLLCGPAVCLATEKAPEDGFAEVKVHVLVNQDGAADAKAGKPDDTVVTAAPQAVEERGAMAAAAPIAKTATQQPKHRIFQYMPDSSKSYGTESMLSEISKEVAGKVYYELKEEGQRNLTSRIAVVAAVPLSDFKRETEFGRIIAEYHLTDLADRGIQVKELRLGSDINILPQTGEFILSRNIGELANNSPELDYVVASTFSNTRKTLILQGRLISLKTGLIKTSWRYNIPLNRELLGLFFSVEQPFTIAVKGMDH
jgi:hypothetical protein